MVHFVRVLFLGISGGISRLESKNVLVSTGLICGSLGVFYTHDIGVERRCRVIVHDCTAVDERPRLVLLADAAECITRRRVISQLDQPTFSRCSMETRSMCPEVWGHSFNVMEALHLICERSVHQRRMFAIGLHGCRQDQKPSTVD